MTKDEALKLAMEAMEITGGFDVEINAIKEALAQPEQKFDTHSVPGKSRDTHSRQPEQEPVAWKTDDVELYVREDKFGFYNIPLYTSPPQRKPLTPQEINQIEARWDAFMHGSKIAFVVRETEAAHGIKGEA